MCQLQRVGGFNCFKILAIWKTTFRNRYYLNDFRFTTKQRGKYKAFPTLDSRLQSSVLAAVDEGPLGHCYYPESNSWWCKLTDNGTYPPLECVQSCHFLKISVFPHSLLFLDPWKTCLYFDHVILFLKLNIRSYCVLFLRTYEQTCLFSQAGALTVAQTTCLIQVCLGETMSLLELSTR